MGSYLNGMLRYFEFSGRSTRMQYWMFFLFQYLLFIAAIFTDYAMGAFDEPGEMRAFFTLIVLFVHIVPSYSVQIRRLHDIGKSGAWWLLNFVPLGGLVVLFWACCPSEPGRNDYDDPEPSSYRPRSAVAATPRFSSIPRQVRMGSATNPVTRSQPAAGRFI